MVNQIPAIINTNPPEPKSSDPELYEVKLDVISCIPSNNFGKEQFEIEAKVEEIDKYYAKKYWIPQSMGRVENGKSYTVAMRRRRLGQTREGVIKEGRNADGSFIKHNWDWEIMAITDYDGVREISTANKTQEPKDFLTEPKEAPMQVASQTTVTNKDQQIARSVALKAAVDIEVAKLDNKLADGSNSMEDIVTNADNFYGYLTQ
tara:strand:- start:1443 stop:2057 length:615 start_codon:yes stop_codon:yes gene_type:complete